MRPADLAAARAAIRELAPNGRLRAAINFGNSVLAQRDPASGEAGGVAVELARELGRRLQVEVELLGFEAAGQVVGALRTTGWDVAFLAIDPARSAEIAFTPPYLLIEGAYVVREESSLRSAEAVDRAGVVVATGAGSAYDLFLARTLKQARIERRDTAAQAFALLADGSVEVAAGVRHVLERHLQQQPELRLLEPSFMVIEQAIGTPVERPAGARYLSDFLQQMKASGLIGDALACSGQRDVQLAR